MTNRRPGIDKAVTKGEAQLSQMFNQHAAELQGDKVNNYDDQINSILKDLSLALDEYYNFDGSTHGLQNGRIVPKGSFIALVERARDLLELRKNKR